MFWLEAKFTINFSRSIYPQTAFMLGNKILKGVSKLIFGLLLPGGWNDGLNLDGLFILKHWELQFGNCLLKPLFRKGAFVYKNEHWVIDETATT
jgi:hypothetical protein